LYAAESSITSRLGELRRTLQHLARLDPALARHEEALEGALYALEEAGRDLGAYADGVEHDPARLDAVRRRQDLLFRLLGKYGPNLGSVLATLESARSELATLDGAGFER